MSPGRRWLRDRPPAPSRLSDFLLTSLGELAGQASAHAYVEPADRREELARTMLARLGLRPAGESAEQARDRLSAVSALERARLLDASRLAEARPEFAMLCRAMLRMSRPTNGLANDREMQATETHPT